MWDKIINNTGRLNLRYSVRIQKQKANTKMYYLVQLLLKLQFPHLKSSPNTADWINPQINPHPPSSIRIRQKPTELIRNYFHYLSMHLISLNEVILKTVVMMREALQTHKKSLLYEITKLGCHTFITRRTKK